MDIYTLTAIWILIGLVLFPIILNYKAPYGRHSSKKWGKTIPNKTGWILMELPALLVCPTLYFTYTPSLYSLNTVFISLWIFHYFNRTIIYPLRIKTKGKEMPLTDFKTAARSHEVIFAADLSAKKNTPIKLSKLRA